MPSFQKRSFSEPPLRRRKHIVSVVVQNDVDTEFVELAKCCICYEGYNKTSRVPISMTCGHTLCKRCVGRLNSDIFFCCPVCRGVTVVGHDEWGKNLVLLQIMEKLGLLASDDDSPAPAPTTSTGSNHRQYTQILSGITYKDAFRYTWCFFDVMTDYIAYKSQNWVEDMKDRMYLMFDDFSAKVEPILRAFLCFIGLNNMADSFKRESAEYSVNGETIEDYYDRIARVNGASGDGPANVKESETNETDANTEEMASEM
uniref:RING-type domain-containing protein n=1 Tax=Panagrellus redivivus TaxID=6233 RepID=A0A7E4ZZ33_PANRE